MAGDIPVYRDRKARLKRSLTILEVLVAAVIASVIIYVITQLYIQGIRLWQLSTTQSDLRSTGRNALERMANDLQLATRAQAGSPPNLSIPAAPNNTDITFYLPQRDAGNNIMSSAVGATVWDTATVMHYRYNAASRQLEGVRNGVPFPVAGDIQSVIFEDRSISGSLNPDELRITITLSRNVPLQGLAAVSFVSVVKLRN